MRTCSFFGIPNVILLGYSGKVKYKDGTIKLHTKVSKTSLGSENDVNLIFMETAEELIDYARTKSLELISIEQGKDSTDFFEWKPVNNAVYIFGNEVTGVEEILLQNSKIVEIPHAKGHNSLNVEVTAGIVISKIAETLQK